MGGKKVEEYLVNLHENCNQDTKDELRKLGYEVSYVSKMMLSFVVVKSDKPIDDLLNSPLVKGAKEAETLTLFSDLSHD